MRARKPRIVLADDHRLILEALVCLLGESFEVVETAANGGELVASAQKFQPDAVLLDLTMPVLSGFDVLRVLVPLLPNTRFVVLTMHTDRGYVRQAFAAGAHGYMVKGASPEELTDALHAVLRGERVVSADLGVSLESLDAPEGPPTRQGSGVLTGRQGEVLRRVAAGLPCKRIAAELGISLKTVEFHKASISRQLGLKTTAQLTRWALTHGFAPPRAGESDGTLVASASGALSGDSAILPVVRLDRDP